MRKITANRQSDERQRITLAEAAAMVPAPDGKRSVAVFEHGTLQVKLYAPRATTYASSRVCGCCASVPRGNGWFVNGPHRHPFAPHDVLFVKAGVVHRFEAFTDDFLVWVFFYGPEGGEMDTVPEA
jgi:hypothetical protein